MAGLDAGEEADPAGEDDDGGAGYLGRFEVLSPAGLSGLNILSGSTVGLSQSSAGRGRLMKSSSSGTSRDREPMVVGEWVSVVAVASVCARGLVLGKGKSCYSRQSRCWSPLLPNCGFGCGVTVSGRTPP